jgi:hypothetical protein
MPLLSDETEATKIAKAIEVFQLKTISNITIADACKKIGISVQQYYRWLSKDNDILLLLRQLLAARAKEQLLMLSDIEHALITEIYKNVEKAIANPETASISTSEALTLLAYVEKKTTMLANSLDLNRPSDIVQDIPAPVLRPGESRLRQNTATIDLKPRPDGSIEISYDIDVESK